MFRPGRGRICVLTAIVFGNVASGFLVRAQTVRTANFLVEAPSTEVARAVGHKAEQLRREIAITWLGSELPQANQASMIRVEVDQERSSGRTVVSATGEGNFVTLVGPYQQVTGSMLAHEMVHAVFAARYGRRLPVWINEGIASMYDDSRRHQIRSRVLRQFDRERLWPDAANLMQGPVDSQSSYTAASSVVTFLLRQDTPAQLLAFAEAGAAGRWDAALQSHYGIASQESLGQEWQQWVKQQIAVNRLAIASIARSRTTFAIHRQSNATSRDL